MIIPFNPDDYVTEVVNNVCFFHKEYPFVSDYPGCTCSGGISLRKATPEEREANRKRRMGGPPTTYAEVLRIQNGRGI